MTHPTPNTQAEPTQWDAVANRAEFEADAAALGLDISRSESVIGEPWYEYVDLDTGHRWAGWLAHAGRTPPASPPADVAGLVADYSQAQIDAMAEALRSQGLTWRQTNFAISLVRNQVSAALALGAAK